MVVLFKDQNYVNVLLQLLEDIKSVSSAKANWQKSEAIIVGSWLCGEPIHGYSQKMLMGQDAICRSHPI